MPPAVAITATRGDESGSELGKPVGLPVGPAMGDRHVPAVGIRGLGETLAKRRGVKRQMPPTQRAGGLVRLRVPRAEGCVATGSFATVSGYRSAVGNLQINMQYEFQFQRYYRTHTHYTDDIGRNMKSRATAAWVVVQIKRHQQHPVSAPVSDDGSASLLDSERRHFYR
jgi:hypothetical protein